MRVEALRGVSLAVTAGGFIAVSGPSGSGKSTLLRAMAGLCPLTSGKIFLSGLRLDAMSEPELALVRRRKVGFVHQLFNLLPDLSAAENVGFPLDLDGCEPAAVRERVNAKLEGLGIAQLADRLPADLSGGEQLRVALARALVIEPEILLADEPTGALDQKSSHTVMDIFERLNQQGTTILMVTHNPDVSRRAQRVVRVVDGQISD